MSTSILSIPQLLRYKCSNFVYIEKLLLNNVEVRKLFSFIFSWTVSGDTPLGINGRFFLEQKTLSLNGGQKQIPGQAGETKLLHCKTIKISPTIVSSVLWNMVDPNWNCFHFCLVNLRRERASFISLSYLNVLCMDFIARPLPVYLYLHSWALLGISIRFLLSLYFHLSSSSNLLKL